MRLRFGTSGRIVICGITLFSRRSIRSRVLHGNRTTRAARPRPFEFHGQCDKAVLAGLHVGQIEDFNDDPARPAKHKWLRSVTPPYGPIEKPSTPNNSTPNSIIRSIASGSREMKALSSVRSLARLLFRVLISIALAAKNPSRNEVVFGDVPSPRKSSREQAPPANPDHLVDSFAVAAQQRRVRTRAECGDMRKTVSTIATAADGRFPRE